LAVLAVGLAAASGGAGCGSPDPWDQPPRFVVLPYEQTGVDGALRAGVAWMPAAGWTSLAVADVVEVPDLSVDFGWSPVGPPPEEARFACEGIDCVEDEIAALGWLVAFVDADGDGTATVDVPVAEEWRPADLVAQGDDRLVGVATDHVLAWAAADLDPGGGLAQVLGWPLLAGASVMGARVEDGRDRLSPTVTRERVPLYLLGRSTPEGEAGLCCDAVSCDHAEVHCPSFQGQ